MQHDSEDLSRTPGSLGNALSRLIRSRGLVDRSAKQTLDVEWKRIVGPELGRHSTARRVRDGVLEVVVSNSAVLQELRGFMHETILEQLKVRLVESGIRGIRYVRER